MSNTSRQLIAVYSRINPYIQGENKRVTPVTFVDVSTMRAAAFCMKFTAVWSMTNNSGKGE